VSAEFVISRVFDAPRERVWRAWTDPDSRRSGRVMKALLQMKKLDIDALKRAYAG
jgi:hypothetical protein